jgi:acetate kinase
VPSRSKSLEVAVDKYVVNMGVISATASLVAVRMIHTDEDVMIAHSVWRALGLGMSG